MGTAAPGLCVGLSGLNLVAPGRPRLRVNVSLDEVIRYSPRRIDVIDLEKESFTTLEIRELLRELRAMGKTIFFSSHILSEVADVCTHIGIIEDGALVAAGDIESQDKDAVAYKQAYALVLEEKWAAAKTAMDELVRQFPKSAWVDDARFWSCYALEKVGQSQESVFKCYQDFVQKYPESEWADEAKSNMIRVAQSLAKAGRPEYQTIIEAYEDAAKDDIKLTALYALQNIGDEEALKTILSIYDKAGSRRLKSQIVFMLEEMESPEAFAKLREIALRESDEDVRRNALFAIGSRGGPESVRLLKEVLASKEAPVEIRRNAMFALAETKDPGMVALLTQIALTDTDREMARTAAFAIQEIEGKEATEALRRILKEAKDREIREAADALGWALAQAITLLAPSIVVLGGGDTGARGVSGSLPMPSTTALR